MVQYHQLSIDASFAALSDPTRRGLLQELGRADASITQLADKFQMTLTGMKKHVAVLERAGLVKTHKVGRIRSCRLGKRHLEPEMAWMRDFQNLWNERFDALDDVVQELKLMEKSK